MKRLILYIGTCLLCMQAYPQGVVEIDTPTNAYTAYYQTKGLDIQYVYRANENIQDYSGNWDLDGDGVKDSLWFVGNGGAHLYYCLRVKLSSKKAAQDFPEICLDLPLYEPSSPPDLNACGSPRFAIADFNGDGKQDIVVTNYIRQTPTGLPGYVVVYYKRGKLLVRKSYTNKGWLK